MQILTSGGRDNKIKFWDLSNNTNTYTLTLQDIQILSMVIFEKDDKHIFVGGMSSFGTIRIWNLNNYSIITVLRGHEKAVDALSLYQIDRKPYLASSSRDGTIKLWSLYDYKRTKSLVAEGAHICTLVVIDEGVSKIFACGDGNGFVKLWNLETYASMGIFKASSGTVSFLQVIRYNGKGCLVCSGDDNTIKAWDLHQNNVMTTSGNSSSILTTRVYMNGDIACLASGHDNREMKIWTE